jgi:hypothetical protein
MASARIAQFGAERPRTYNARMAGGRDDSPQRSRRAVWLAVAVVSLACLGCGDDGPQAFTTKFASAACKRIFECCAPLDRVVQTDAKDEASCVATVGSGMRDVGSLIAMGLIRFDAAAAAQCLANLTQPCSAIFEPRYGHLVACGDVFPGALPLGGACEDLDFICASGDCEGVCAERAPGCAALSCAPDQFCVSGATGCQPRAGLGESCATTPCADGLTCASTQACAAQQPDGQPCRFPSDCVSSCSSLTPAAGTSVCRPGFCQGT